MALADITALAGTSTPLAVTMTQASLELAAHDRHRDLDGARQRSINAGLAASTDVSAQAFSATSAHRRSTTSCSVCPGLTVQQPGSQQDRSIVVGGVQPYETQVLVDGHPLAQGQYGVWVSTYFPSFLIGSAEVQSGPGNTTPFANLAVGGTANLLTAGFTKPRRTLR